MLAPLTKVLVLVSGLAVVGQAAQAADTASARVDTAVLACTPFESQEVGNSTVRASGDTVEFTLYYVDTECHDSVYELVRSGRHLALRRVSKAGSACVKGSDSLYAVSGTIAQVPSGTYQFELWGIYGPHAKQLLFAQNVTVTGQSQ